MPRLPALLAAVAFATTAAAQDPKPADKKPSDPGVLTAPDGWKYVKSGDKSFAFLLPRDCASERSEDGNFKQEGFSGKTKAFIATTKDGKEFAVLQMNLGGPATKDMKIDDVYDLMYDSDKSGVGTKISEPKPIVVGKLKGYEYVVTDKGQPARRVVTVVVKGRVVQSSVTAPRRDQLTTPDAQTFLTSLVLYATAPKKPADKADKKGE